MIPGTAVLGREDADGVAGDGLARCFVRVRDDGAEVEEDVALGQEGPVLVVEDVKPICGMTE